MSPEEKTEELDTALDLLGTFGRQMLVRQYQSAKTAAAGEYRISIQGRQMVERMIETKALEAESLWA